MVRMDLYYAPTYYAGHYAPIRHFALIHFAAHFALNEQYAWSRYEGWYE
jgi:hypothetical protein